jgi:hypothetical protein
MFRLPDRALVPNRVGDTVPVRSRWRHRPGGWMRATLGAN